MINFTIVNNSSDIISNFKWKTSVDFKNKNTVVDNKGKPVAANYTGCRYQIIAKQKRRFSSPEKLARRIVGTWKIAYSFGKERSSKKIKNLFTKDYESRFYGIFINNDQTATDFILLFPKDINLTILSYLNEIELAQLRQVNKTYQALASSDFFPPKIAFGKKEWQTYFGEIGKEPLPSLPKNIQQILKSPCPFWPEKKVEETHILMLIPETVKGIPLNLNNLKEIIKFLKGDQAYKHTYKKVIPDEKKLNRTITSYYPIIPKKISNKYGYQTVAKAHWILMTKDVIPKTIRKSYEEQKKFFTTFAKKAKIHYQMPNLLDVVISIMMYNLLFEKNLVKYDFPEEVFYTACQEQFQGYQILVGGGFHSVTFIRFANKYSKGMVALCKFF